MGRLKTYIEMQTEGEHIGKKQRQEKQERSLHPSQRRSLQCSNFPKHLDCCNQEKLNGNLHLYQDQCPLWTCPDAQQYFSFVIPAALERDPALNRNCREDQPPEKDHFKDPGRRRTSKARKHLMELEAWDTLTHCILHLEAWGLCEVKDTCHF